jgi:PhzF family phenazine biosynthesis protein
MQLTIYQLDAFATDLFKGNPAAVVPLQQWLPDSLMQSIAAENNLSETAFIVPLGTPGNYHIRWFTPTLEIDLCGHATLAAACVIHRFLDKDIRRITFTTQVAGTLQVTYDGERYTLDFPERMPQPCNTPNGLLTALGVTEVDEVMKSRDYFVVLRSEEAVRAIAPDFAALAQMNATGIIVSAPGKHADAVSRCFYPGAGVNEDPVTGSAHCNIVPYWAQKLGKTELLCEQASARGGLLYCTLSGNRVLMSGYVVLYMNGIIYLP